MVSGRADQALLDSYEDERIPVARRLLDTTDRAFSLVVSDNLLAGLVRTKVLAKVAALAMTSPRVQEFMFGTISQIGIHYRESALSRTLPGLPGSAPQAGDRFPWLKLSLGQDGTIDDLFQLLDDTRFTLLLFGQPAPDSATLPLGDLLRVLVVPSNPVNDRELSQHDIPQPSFYLLRPDGHIMLTGAQFTLSEANGLRLTRTRLCFRPLTPPAPAPRSPAARSPPPRARFAPPARTRAGSPGTPAGAAPAPPRGSSARRRPAPAAPRC